MKTYIKLFVGIILLLNILGMSSSFSSFLNSSMSNSPFKIQTVILAFKAIIYFEIYFIAELVDKLIKSFEKNGFLYETSVFLLRKIGFISLSIILLISIIQFYNQPDLATIVNQPFTHIFRELINSFFSESSSLLFLLVILLFLLANFVQKAITIKNENESFI